MKAYCHKESEFFTWWGLSNSEKQIPGLDVYVVDSTSYLSPGKLWRNQKTSDEVVLCLKVVPWWTWKREESYCVSHPLIKMIISTSWVWGSLGSETEQISRQDYCSWDMRKGTHDWDFWQAVTERVSAASRVSETTNPELRERKGTAIHSEWWRLCLQLQVTTLSTEIGQSFHFNYISAFFSSNECSLST